MRPLFPTMLVLIALCASAAVAAPPEAAATSASPDTDKPPSTEPAGGTLTLLEIADCYEQTQNKLRSFILVTEVLCRTEGTLGGKPIDPPKRWVVQFEVRTDGEKTKCIMKSFPPFSPGMHYVGQDPFVLVDLWDGKDYYDYVRPVELDQSGHLTLTPDMPPDEARKRGRRQCDSTVPWRLTGDPLTPLEESLRSRAGISLRAEMEQVNGVGCYVIDAPLERGRMTLWLDPAHGYHIAKAEGHQELTAPRIATSQGGRESVSVIFSDLLEVRRFEPFDGVWAPVELVTTTRQDSGPDNVTEMRVSRKVTKLVLNPDHEALRSFLPDEIPNGTRVEVVGDEKFVYRWQNGELIPHLFRTRGTGRVKGSVAAGGTLRFPSTTSQPADKDSAP